MAMAMRMHSGADDDFFSRCSSPLLHLLVLVDQQEERLTPVPSVHKAGIHAQ